MTFGSDNSTGLRFRETKRREGFLARATLVVALLVGAAVFYIWSHEEVVRMGMELNGLRKEGNGVKKENERLSMECAKLRALKRIEKIASEDLDMVYPDPSSIRAVREP